MDARIFLASMKIDAGGRIGSKQKMVGVARRRPRMMTMMTTTTKMTTKTLWKSSRPRLAEERDLK